MGQLCRSVLAEEVLDVSRSGQRKVILVRPSRRQNDIGICAGHRAPVSVLEELITRFTREKPQPPGGRACRAARMTASSRAGATSPYQNTT